LGFLFFFDATQERKKWTKENKRGIEFLLEKWRETRNEEERKLCVNPSGMDLLSYLHERLRWPYSNMIWWLKITLGSKFGETKLGQHVWLQEEEIFVKTNQLKGEHLLECERGLNQRGIGWASCTGLGCLNHVGWCISFQMGWAVM
jgi:hypothetical protein